MTFEDLRKTGRASRPTRVGRRPSAIAGRRAAPVLALWSERSTAATCATLAAMVTVVGFTAMWPFYRSLPWSAWAWPSFWFAAPVIVYMFLSAQRPTPTPSPLRFWNARGKGWPGSIVRFASANGCLVVRRSSLYGGRVIAWAQTPGRPKHFAILMLVNALIAIGTIYRAAGPSSRLMPVPASWWS